MSGSYTPGPWSTNLPTRSDGALLACHVQDAAGISVCQLAAHHDPVTAANAHLIAAAPELLEGAIDTLAALRLLRQGLSEHALEAVRMIDAHVLELEYAIAKAQGCAA